MSPDSHVSALRTARGFGLGTFLALLLFLPLGALDGSTALAVPPTLWQPDRCQSGTGAGQCIFPRGVVADPVDGHVFVAEQTNRRISEFNARGQFVKAWGWGVDDGGAELQTCTAASSCQAAGGGTNPGQFNGLHGLAIDSAGNVYANDRNNHRVQKFDPQGNFLLMFGGGVDQGGGTPSNPGDVCTAEYIANGDTCGAGSAGSSSSEFGSWPVGDFIEVFDNGTATTTDDKIYVGDVNRIQVFDTEGGYQEEFPVPGTVQSLTVDDSGNLYVIYSLQADVRKLTPAGLELETPRFEVENPNGSSALVSAVAVDSAGSVYAFGPTSAGGGLNNVDPIVKFAPSGEQTEAFGRGEFDGSTGLAANLCAGSEGPGNLYVSNASSTNSFVRAYGTDPAGCFKARTGEASGVAETSATLNGTVDPSGLTVSGCHFEYGIDATYGFEAPCIESPAGSDAVPVHADISGLTKGTVYHFRLVAKVGGETETGADETFKTLGPPVSSNDRTVDVIDTQATLEALLNPEGFATTYAIQYGVTSSYGQSTATIPLFADREEHAVSVVLEGLTPDTTYHWRIVAANSSGTVAGEDHAFTTYRSFTAEDTCPNHVFRTGSSALLPDCRAYEMVSPVDKNGGNIIIGLAGVADPYGYIQASADGNRIAYTSFASFGDEPNSFVAGNQYLASREDGPGWSTRGIHPPAGGNNAAPAFSFGFAREFMAFTPDLCDTWLYINQTPPPTADGQLGYPNLYRRDNCEPGEGTLEALVPSPPALPEGMPLQYVDNGSLQGISADGSKAFFVAKGGPLPNVMGAGLGGNSQIYERVGGVLVLASVLPGGNATMQTAEAGSGWHHNLENAVSTNGTRLYWTAGIDNSGEGQIFVRRHPEQGPGGDDCADPAKACTQAVGGSALLPAFFWAASPDGSRALIGETNFAGGKDLYRFSVNEKGEAQPKEPIATEVEGVLGESDDLQRIYFISREKIADSGENSNEDEAIEGEPNVYLSEGEATRFIGTLVEGDVGQVEATGGGLAYVIGSDHPYLRASRVSPDGRHLTFESRASLTGFDNRDASSGEPAVEVFAYEANGALHCVSCTPSRARPRSRILTAPYDNAFLPKAEATKVPAAAWIPTWEHPLHASNAMSDNGTRIFFNSNDKLLPRDSNGAQDVYEWEAPDTGSCTTASPSYFTENDGCLYLISSGESRFESIFWEARPDGRDAFFTTESSLLPQDPGLVDLYDARAGGGLPQPQEKAACEGEACQSPPPAPEFQTPASSAYHGPGNPPLLRNCRGPARRAARLSRRARRLHRAARRVKAPARAKRLQARSRRFAGKARRLSRNAKRCRHANGRALR